MREKIVRVVAGTLVMASVLLAAFVNMHWLWLAVFVSANLIQSSFTDFCPLEKILDRLGVAPSGKSSCD